MPIRASLTIFLEIKMKQSNKKQTPMVILILFVMTIIVIPNALADDVTISIGNLTADPGETCTAPVVLKSIKDYGTGAITLKYDPSIVHVTDVKSSDDSIVVAWNADNEIGEAKVAAWNINSVSGNIDFAIISFKAANNRGSTPLTIIVDELIIQDHEGIQNRIVGRVINGSFTSDASSIPGFELLQVLIILGVIIICHNKIINKK